MGPRPAAFVRAFEPGRERHRFEPLVHRWIRGRDLLALMLILRRMLREHGSIEAFFAAGDDPAAPDVRDGARVVLVPRPRHRRRAPPTARACRPAPASATSFHVPPAGSACKRLNLFLRWMVRRDAIDLGVWHAPRPSRLVVPLDTHVIRLGRCLRLTRRVSPGWTMAADITAALRAIDGSRPGALRLLAVPRRA